MKQFGVMYLRALLREKQRLGWEECLPDSINSWKEFKKIFLAEFGAVGTIMKDETFLFEMRQKTKESVSFYITRFNKELDSLDVIEEKSVIMCFIGGLQFRPLRIELMSRGPKNRIDMFLVAHKMALVEENKEERRGSRLRGEKEKVEDDHEEKRDANKSTDHYSRNDRERANGCSGSNG